MNVKLGGIDSSVYRVESIHQVKENLDPASKTLWVCDSHTQQYLPKGVDVVILPPGEETKSFDGIDLIVERALELQLDRNSTFVALGGGVVCDITAFVASIYMRGCSLVLVPTTLLAMVDASLGGKTAIDFKETKNLLGSFYPAHEIYIYSHSLHTLSDQEFLSGLGEVIKHSLLTKERELYTYLLNNKEQILLRDDRTLSELILYSLEVKRSFIEQDPQERLGLRAALNLGHTFAHALEVESSFGITHGEAVMWGVAQALEIGVTLHITDSEFAQQYLSLIQEYGYSLHHKINDRKLFFAAMERDKKRSSKGVFFVLMAHQGQHVYQQISRSVLEKQLIIQ
ncbi:MAG: 3-dehydroquinate synthase [Sphaerochaetaceae bacterium]